MLGIDVLRQRDLPLERPVLDLHLLVVPAVLGPPALTRDQQRLRRRDQLNVLGVDARQLDLDGQGRRVVAAVDVDLPPVAAAPAARERKDLPEIGEELLDLLRSVLEVAAFLHELSLPRWLVSQAWSGGPAPYCVSAGRFSPSGS